MMQGRRLPDHADGSLPEKMEPGDYCYSGDKWFVRAPNGSLAFLNPGHTITEHDDGAITVQPSILIREYEGSPYWHGWLTHGVWIEA